MARQRLAKEIPGIFHSSELQKPSTIFHNFINTRHTRIIKLDTALSSPSTSLIYIFLS
jgi:hypothetical protein